MQNKKNSFLIRSALKIFSVLHFLLNAALACLALALGISIFSSYFRFSVKAPDFVAEKIGEFARENGAFFEAGELSFCFDGTLSAKDVGVDIFGSERPAIRAREVSVKIDMLKLLAGRISPIGVSVNCASAYSMFGESANRPVLENFFARATKMGGGAKLEYCSGNIGNLAFFLSGDLSAQAVKSLLSLSESEGKTEPESLISKWDFACDKLFEIGEAAAKIKRPCVCAEFSADSLKSVWCLASASAEEYSFKMDGKSFSARSIRAFAKFDSEKSSDSFDFFARASDFDSSLGARAKIAAVSGVADFGKKSLRDVSASAFGLFYKGCRADSATLFKPLTSLENPYGEISALAKIGGGDISINAELARGKARAKFFARLMPSEILKCSEIPQVEELKDFEFGGGLFLNGSLSLSFEQNFANPKIGVFSFFDFGESIVTKIPVEFGGGYLTYDSQSGEFWGRDLRVKSVEGWKICGDVYQNVKNYDYLFLLRGSLQPPAISHFMAPWWEEVFSNIIFKSDFPDVDIYISSRWMRPEIMHIYGSVSGKNITRGGVQFDSADMAVWITPERISIFDLLVKRQNRKLSGMLEWTYPTKQIDSYEENRVIVETSLNQKELIAMGGRRVEDVSKMLKFSGAPRLKLTLHMPNPYRYKNPQDTLNLICDAPGSVKASKFDLRDVKFSAYARGDDIYLRGVDAVCAGGKVAGSLNLLKKDGKDYFEFEATMENLREYDFYKQLYALGDSPHDEPAESAKFGRISGRAKLKGFLDDAKSISGSGEAVLRNPQLADIHLLGAISRAADSMKIPFGSFYFTEARSPFEVSDSIIDFGDIAIFGPSARVTGSSHYNFMSGGINAKLLFKPFASISTPLFSQIFNAINPLLSSIEVEIKGKFADPKISISISPLNIFRSDKRIIEGFGDMLDAESL